VNTGPAGNDDLSSKRTGDAEWNNSGLGEDNIAGEISKMKQDPVRDMMIYGNEKDEDGT
jgi:hypothetical protein